ncbi:MAG: hypothetical protein GWN87_21945, partial [Desulfuromonadales bacterium]|nr:hypothetical protein [Desulfuromonadales bacterium]
SADGVAKRLSALAEGFRNQTKELDNASEAANHRIRDAGDALSRQAEKLLGTTDDAKREMEAIKQTV